MIPGSPSPVSPSRAGRQRHLDPYLAFQRACLHAIDHLTVFEAYLLLGAAPVRAHLSSVVDIPNACVTLHIPTGIFDFDIRPGAQGPHQVVSDLHPPRADAARLGDEDVLRAVPKNKRTLLPAARRLRGARRPSPSARSSVDSGHCSAGERGE
jgi:formamidase